MRVRACPRKLVAMRGEKRIFRLFFCPGSSRMRAHGLRNSAPSAGWVWVEREQGRVRGRERRAMERRTHKHTSCGNKATAMSTALASRNLGPSAAGGPRAGKSSPRSSRHQGNFSHYPPPLTARGATLRIEEEGHSPHSHLPHNVMSTVRLSTPALLNAMNFLNKYLITSSKPWCGSAQI